MVAPAGRRAANHAATHQAIVSAANRLFAQQGFEATSVREIAQHAGIGERTFYRYFDGKEALLANEFDAWLSRLAAAISSQPPQTAMLDVVCAAMCELVREPEEHRPTIKWLIGTQPRPLELLRRSSPRPLRRLELTIESALADRLAESKEPDLQLRCDVAGRVSVAALRSAVSRARAANGRPFPTLVEESFDALIQVVAHAGPLAPFDDGSGRHE